ncbi:hypothetical protein OF83DRAFT_1227976 [Amylostereum chailletii]|nr:hypothetical protein OF83DRAFT_1227976 [Amylostereum chailletii]
MKRSAATRFVDCFAPELHKRHPRLFAFVLLFPPFLFTHPTMPPDRVPLALTRTPSVASAVSSDADDAGKRSRKRFANSQVVILEQLYHISSHPTREERELVARDLNTESKSVNIWFQNRRQTERRALRSAASKSASKSKSPSAAPPPSSPFSPTSSAASASASAAASTSTSGRKRGRGRGRSLAAGFSSPFGAGSTAFSEALSLARSHSSPLPYASPHSRGYPYARTPSAESLADAGTPTLDALAARTELRTRTPRRSRTRVPYRAGRPEADEDEEDEGEGGLWDNMPSSPLAPESPECGRPWGREKGMVEYGRRGTLEWACARERVKRAQSEETDAAGDAGADGDGLGLGLGLGGEKMDVDGDEDERAGGDAKTAQATTARDEDEDEDEPLPGTAKRARTTRARTRLESAKKQQKQQATRTAPSTATTATTAKAEAKATGKGQRTTTRAQTQPRAPGPVVAAGEDTEEDDAHEAITPLGSLSDALWGAPAPSAPKRPRRAPVADEDRDEELMSAALVLCGLAGRLA